MLQDDGVYYRRGSLGKRAYGLALSGTGSHHIQALSLSLSLRQGVSLEELSLRQRVSIDKLSLPLREVVSINELCLREGAP